MYTQMLGGGLSRRGGDRARASCTYHTDSRGNVVTCGVLVRPLQKSANPDTRARAPGRELSRR